MESFRSKEDSYSAVLACRHIRLILQKGMAARVTIWPVNDLPRRVIGYAKIRETIASIRQLMSENDFNLDTIIRSEGFARMAQVQNGADALSGKDDVRKRFGIMARELFRMFKYVERGRLDDERVAKDAISAVYDTMHQQPPGRKGHQVPGWSP